MKRILIFIVVLTAMSLIFGIANSKAKGKISGRVTDESGNGIPNVYINVYDYNSNNWINGSHTDSEGNYRLNVPAGTYKVRFSQSASDGYYAPKWYNDKNNSAVADLVTVKSSRTTSNINAQLEIGGTISGRVTDASGDAIADVYVSALDPNSSNWIYGLDTDENGNYSFNLPVGAYKIHFSPSSSSGYYAPGWYDNKRNDQVADLVTITPQTTSNADAQLEIGGTISGRVTGPGGRKGIADVYVGAEDTNGHWMGGSDDTDSKGNYSFNLPVGTYKVYFSPLPSNGYYAPELYDNKGHRQVADLVTITEGQTASNINARLEIGGKISGQVTDASGNGIAYVYVYACDPDNNTIIFKSARTDSEGFYTIPLAAGDYKVGFIPYPGTGNYASEWYNNKSDFESADRVKVKKRTNSRINTQLEPK